MHDLILRAWQQKNFIYYIVLIPLSWLFAGLSALRRGAYHIGLLRKHRLPVPVVIVGNINMGGSGKTPVVMWLVEQLMQAGYRPGVISRGYGAKNSQPIAVQPDSAATTVGDEPLLIVRRTHCPVWVGVDRVAAAKALLRAQPDCDVIISDDGLQHYRLQRDIEIAVADEQTTERQHLLPAGPLREPMRRLQTVDAVVSHGPQTIAGAFHMQLQSQTFYNLENPSLQAEVADFKRQTVVAIAGIGKPERFFNYLRDLGLDVEGVSFQDHHGFTAQDLNSIECDALIMTEKDAVKCETFAERHHWVLPVSAQIDATLMPLLLVKLKAASELINDRDR